MLPGVSRTFAVGIRLLPGDLGAAVRCAYLLCRIADTIEDEPVLDAPAKAELLTAFAHALDDAAAADAFPNLVRGVAGDAPYVRLMRGSDLVLVAYRALPDATRAHVRRWVGEMIGGMRKFVLAYPRGVRIQSLDEYREYCYYVAGTVGYLLTDLWREHAPSIGAREYAALRERSRAFGEALQTVNILKDVARDAEHENSIYIPDELLRAHGSEHATILTSDRGHENHAALGALVQLAWRDLEHAKAYLLAIPRRAVAIRLFCALPLLFAYATLRDVTARPGALARRENVKISRSEVKSLTVLSVLGVLSNRALAALVERARTKPLVLGG
ncbi:MAG TPA: phytoene/squalene synthase family protein [Gemmatimonadaceae bacterium]|nr:phytoene/squalene synthase family protein [Gemmatimonadaceae bacterium]